jgi:ubiquinone biosynthesis protein UbiJ
MLPDTLLKPLEALLNRRLAAATPATALCEELEGCTLVIDPEELPAIAFTVVDGELRLSFEIGESPAAIVSGPLVELTRFANAGSLDAAREVSVTVQGETRTAAAFAGLLAIARPDFEEELSRLLGDVPARQVGNALRGMGDWLVRAGNSLHRDVAEFLQEESRDVPPRAEVEAFEARLHALDDRLASLRRRIEAIDGGRRR